MLFPQAKIALEVSEVVPSDLCKLHGKWHWDARSLDSYLEDARGCLRSPPCSGANQAKEKYCICHVIQRPYSPKESPEGSSWQIIDHFLNLTSLSRWSPMLFMYKFTHQIFISPWYTRSTVYWNSTSTEAKCSRAFGPWELRKYSCSSETWLSEAQPRLTASSGKHPELGEGNWGAQDVPFCL